MARSANGASQHGSVGSVSTADSWSLPGSVAPQGTLPPAWSSSSSSAASSLVQSVAGMALNNELKEQDIGKYRYGPRILGVGQGISRLNFTWESDPHLEPVGSRNLSI